MDILRVIASSQALHMVDIIHGVEDGEVVIITPIRPGTMAAGDFGQMVHRLKM